MNTQIMAILERRHVKYRIKRHKKPVFTSMDAARERGVEPSQIVKTMLLTSSEGKIILAVVPGNRRLNINAIKNQVDQKDLRLMNREGIESLGDKCQDIDNPKMPRHR